MFLQYTNLLFGYNDVIGSARETKIKKTDITNITDTRN